ncbi:MAG TPA: NAD(P)/FAD-dependent oxidoreductase [Flavipsychrobacter sp.]|nr:NAD(P)/FAD-dependent oxidoreductase [Flavipsychrobacter sp.]
MQIAIIGAGAAGCFAAANIPLKEGREVTIFEKTGKALQKVKVSGGGRCNTTHHLFDIPDLVARYPRGKQFLKKLLYRFGPEDTIRWFEERGVQLKAEADGRMFPVTDQSQTIIDCIWQEMMRQKVNVRYHKSLNRIERKDGAFDLHFNDGSIHIADRIVIACGGFPKEDQYNWLKELGHTIQSPVPSLFTFNLPGHPITELMGVSLSEVTLKVAGTKIAEKGPILITHWGLSGPVVLRASAWGARALHEKNYHFGIQINWLNEKTEQELKEDFSELRKSNGKQYLFHKNPFGLPKRLWEFLLVQSGATEQTRWGDATAAIQNKLIQHLIRYQAEVAGKTTFKEEFVTCGGISLSEIDVQTMESKIVAGLYFAGEITDVDGITGGFNFQYAWASGSVAAIAMDAA